MSPSAPNVAVIGGGISGLSTAFYLRKLRPTTTITLFESSSRLGGNIRTERRDDFVVDAGPDSFMRAKPAAMELCRELGLESEFIGARPGARRVYVARQGQLQAVPEGLVMGVPTRLGPLLRSNFLSLSGKLRMLAEALIPSGFGRSSTDANDESIAAFMIRRFGKEAALRFAAPMLAGIYAGDAERLSMNATFPLLSALEQQHGSVIWGLLLAQYSRTKGALQHPRLARLEAALQWLAGAPIEPQESPFVSLRSGMGTLISALASHLGETRVLVGRQIDSVQRAGDGWSVFTAGNRLEFDAVVLAPPAHVAANLLSPGPLSDELRAIRYASTATAFFGFDERSLARPLEGAGFIVPPGEGSVLAGTWITSKWEGRAPDGSILVRAFLGGTRSDTDVTQQDDETLVALAFSELQRLAGGFGKPRFTSVHRHVASNPQPSLGHRERVARINTELAALPNLHLAGAAYDGVSIADCVRQARVVAERISSAA
jgi:protoporphyrinogen/coproporphyrinogen III oxidase